MDVPDRRVRQWLAHVRPATLVALVRLGRAMVDLPALRPAVDAAAPELGVERVEHVGVDRAGLESADEGADVILEVSRVHEVRARADVDHLEVAVEQLVDRRRRSRVPALVDLVEHPRARGLSLSVRTRSGRNDLDEVVPTPADGVDASVDAHAVGAAGEAVDAAAGPLAACLSTGHDLKVRNVRVMNRVTTRDR
ncbi:hypothetical protein [Pseudonocardia sp. NPDC049154]|uniref:hypothetical protein n=1 Tax=Pseudonocardia sp. NPDC049154 TaxID=3155501 RepID=UPI0033D00012